MRVGDAGPRFFQVSRPPRLVSRADFPLMRASHLTIRVSVLVCGILTLALAGCATMFRPSTRSLAVDSSPRGATVYVDGLVAGITPVILQLSPWEHELDIRQTGYPAHHSLVRVRGSVGWMFADMLLLGLPLYVDVPRGALNSFRESRLDHDFNVGRFAVDPTDRQDVRDIGKTEGALAMGAAFNLAFCLMILYALGIFGGG